jgi:EAL domain-containing protein (putative c-di-GMP-specific phosphodiesterase class I)
VIAEGVETLAQANFLKTMGCEEAQGYLYSKPVTSTEFSTLLASKK